MSDTPRTDAAFDKVYRYPGHATEIVRDSMVNLERELTEAIKQRDEAQSELREAEEALCQVSGLITGINPGDGEGTTYGEIIEQVVRLKGERVEWKECAEELAAIFDHVEPLYQHEKDALERFRKLKGEK